MRSIKDIHEEYGSLCAQLGDLVVKRDAIDRKIQDFKDNISMVEKEYAKAKQAETNKNKDE